MRLSTTTFIDGICTWMKKKRKGAFHSKRRSSSVSSITVKSLTSLNDYEATESREYETYDLNLPASIIKKLILMMHWN